MGKSDETEEARLARKQAKKEAKKLLAMQASSETPDLTNNKKKEEKEEVKKEKKQKKKDKKRKRDTDDLNAGTVTTTHADEKDEKRLKKKMKKKNKVILENEVLAEGQISSTTTTNPTANPTANPTTATSHSVTDKEKEEFLKLHNITIQGPNADSFRPVLEFKQSGLPASLLSSTKTFAKPTPIQSTTWPILLQGKDLVGIAETGSGKTLAFALPALDHILKLPSEKMKHRKGPLVLVIAPTRELALQTQATFEVAAKAIQLQSQCIYGGMPKHLQKAALRSNPAILVATPGRLIDFMDEGVIDISTTCYLILDEADRMLDQGFEPDIRKIIGQIPAKTERRTNMFSATWPEAIRKLAHEFLNEPVRVAIGSTALATSQTVTQHVIVLETAQEKQFKLLELLKKCHKDDNRILIFVLYKKEVPFLERILRQRGYNVGSLAGDKAQHAREAALDGFKDGSVPILVATDVAARGLDISGVEYVINYTFPLTIEDYVHRCGRTGRGGASGIAYTFFTSFDKSHSGELINVLKAANANVPNDLLAFGTTVKKKEHKMYGAHFKDIDPTVKGTKIRFD